MTEGDIVIASIQQADGIRKNRPGVFLRADVLRKTLGICSLRDKGNKEI